MYCLVSSALHVRQLLLHFLISGGAFGAGRGRLRRLLVKHWYLIEKSLLLSRFFPNRPTIDFRTYKNRARLEDSKIIYKID